MHLKCYGEVLPYLEVKKENEEEIIEKVSMPNVIGISLKEAEKILKEIGLEISTYESKEKTDKENTIIIEQIPAEGISINKGSKVFVKY